MGQGQVIACHVRPLAWSGQNWCVNAEAYASVTVAPWQAIWFTLSQLFRVM